MLHKRCHVFINVENGGRLAAKDPDVKYTACENKYAGVLSNIRLSGYVCVVNLKMFPFIKHRKDKTITCTTTGM